MEGGGELFLPAGEGGWFFCLLRLAVFLFLYADLFGISCRFLFG